MAFASARLLIRAFAARFHILGDVAHVVEEVGEGDIPAIAYQLEEDVIAASAAPRQELFKVAALPSRLVAFDPNARACNVVFTVFAN